MKSYVRVERVDTSSKEEVLDVTNLVEKAINKSGVKEGVAIVFLKHTTAALCINEAERGLMDDILKTFSTLVKENKYKHDEVDRNATSHLRSILILPSLVLPVSGGSLQLGTWQRILMIEFDGPRRRELYVQVIGE
ncbi:hypothetical protein B6U74_07015 [Candidatus Bathyarchaeota archaeon ex4484_205]|nr:MAG: hypothetical protein B6U74_07015 [Candidatus Bathyarchaeota archaeon ex4484_205]RLF90756.1 MAG: YjbQ family protein [Thermococci archaeon]RLF95053.1 MAG: YjbQ family protein [Thermococci archaeon]